MRYDYFIVDAVNFAYKTFSLVDPEKPEYVGKKEIYKGYACKFINCLEDLKKKYLDSEGKIILLFDNYFSRADMQSSFNFADRKRLDEAYKATRKKENKQFYQTLNFLRYYYLIGPDQYITARLDNLEADDLVKPTLELITNSNSAKTTLLITSDLDWCRYLSNNVQWLPSLKDAPQYRETIEDKLGFKLTESSLIAYKAVFGDVSDNISAIASERKFKPQFVELADQIQYPEKLILLARDRDNQSKYPLLECVNASERQYIINVQLISAIPCSKENLQKVMVAGRYDKTLYKSVREAIGLVESNTFVFGNIKRPRA